MNKDIKYSGYTAVPSDYECQDGQLDLALNFTNDLNNSLEPFYKPKQVFKLVYDNEVLLGIHTPQHNHNYIISRPQSDGLFGIYWISAQCSDSSDAKYITSLPKVVDFAITGNIIILNTAVGLYYLLFKENVYVDLGNQIPFIGLEFALSARKSLSLAERHVFAKETIIPINRDGNIDVSNESSGATIGHGRLVVKDGQSKLRFSDTTNIVMGLILSEVSENITSKGYFWQPFFVRYAMRTYTGSYVHVSPPVLMLPSVLPPALYSRKEDSSKYDEENWYAGIRGEIPYNSLQFRLSNYDVEKLKIWSDIITDVDIFVSAPIYTFHQDKDFIRRPGHFSIQFPSYLLGNYSRDNISDNPSFRGENSSVSTASIQSPSSAVDNENDKNDNHGLIDGIVEEIPDEVDPMRDPVGGGGVSDSSSGGATGSTVKFSCFNSHCLCGNEYGDMNQTYFCHYNDINSQDDYFYWPIVPNDEIDRNIVDVKNFYRIASIPINDITASNDFRDVKLTHKDLNSLVTFPSLEDDIIAPQQIHPSCIHVYNSRLSVANTDLSPAEIFPLRASTSYTGPSDILSSQDFKPISVHVWTIINGQKCIVSHNDNSDELWKLYLPDTNFPRYLFYPDSNAYKIAIEWEISQGQRKIICLPLKRHDFLDGAYYFGGFSTNFYPSDRSVVEPADFNINTFAHLSNRVYTTEVNNPFVFKKISTVQIGDGAILAMSSAVKALSQGQYGQFPLYAFTNEGVWALQLDAAGNYISKSPVNRLVCNNPKSITQLDDAVAFSSDQGLVILSGSETQIISDSLMRDFPSKIFQMPSFEKITSIFDSDIKDIISTTFSEHLGKSLIIYDYSHQRLLVSNSKVKHCYIYSLKSNLWTSALISADYKINSYPNALAVSNNGFVFDYSTSTNETQPSLLVTRPLKLGDGDVHKTIDNIIQRGNFAKSHVQSVLYGSRDLINWHLVWSSKDHFLRGFRGTPYKYFRIALLCNLSAGESIYGASVQFTPRLTNQPR